MSLYRHTVTAEVRDFDPSFIGAHPKAALWETYTPPPAAPTTVTPMSVTPWQIRRDNPMIAGMAAQLGMTDAQIDDLFTLAATFQ